jgi:response regulator RpfG family c-di-GMP phosphodiesterase
LETIAMRQHVEIGVRILQPIPGFESVRELVQCHHEHWDGGGYPLRLRGERIPLAARLFSICDAFDAMTSDRPYRKSLGETAALAEIETQAGRQFDPHLAEQFIELAQANQLPVPSASPSEALMRATVAMRKPSSGGRVGPVRVHVVDDDPIVRAWMRESFDQSEFEVDGEADTANEAEVLCRDRQADVILINQRLGVDLGTDLVRHLRQQGPLPPVLITSANKVKGLNETAREAGAQGSLHVSAQPEKLLAALRALVAGDESFDLDHPRRFAGQRTLSPREREVLQQVATGHTNREIAATVGVSLETVNTMLDRVRAKLGVHRRGEAVAEARKLSIIA